MIARLSCFACGLLFAAGLGLSGMTQPLRVLGFLDVAGSWDPSLAFVMATAIPIFALAFWLARSLRAPLFAPALPPLARTPIDARLIGGALLFGAGWGISGICPGPALVNLGGLVPGAGLFVAAMVAGQLLHRLFEFSAVAREEPRRKIGPL